MGTAGLNSMSEAQQGIAPRLAEDIFAHASTGCSLAVTVSCLEIYGEELHDLLADNSKTKLQIREHPGGQISVAGLLEATVSTREELLDALGKGKLQRKARRVRSLIGPKLQLPSLPLIRRKDSPLHASTITQQPSPT